MNRKLGPGGGRGRRLECGHFNCRTALLFAAAGAGANRQAAGCAAGRRKAPHAAATASTPEMRSAAALALSADPVFDEGTYLRIKETLLSYADIQVRGGWPMLPADAKLAPGASGPDVALLRRHLVIGDDLPAEQEAGDVYDVAVVEGVKRFQVRHGLDATGSVGAQTLRRSTSRSATASSSSKPRWSGCSAWISCSPNATSW